jgi:enoyl-CoA hydratase/3-hydroxyacyl-CoA dehydrogenase
VLLFSFSVFPFCAANLQSRVKKGNLTQERFEKALSLVKGSLNYDSFRDVDLVIEVLE